MRMIRPNYLLGILALLLTGCSDGGYTIPTIGPGLKNDVIKRTSGPNVVGLDIEFAYAMALLPADGKLVSAKVTASIPGSEGTYLDNKSYYTNSAGVDVGIPGGAVSSTSGNVTAMQFSKDTMAATLRYFYRIPEEARGKKVSFTFSATATNGQSVTYEMGPYEVRSMDMKLDLVARDSTACYISLADMAVYNAAYAAANPDKIDLVYLYRSVAGKTFAHALVAPGAGAEYLPGVTLPSRVKNKTKMVKAWNIRDQQLARLQYGVFVDDVDLQKFDYTNAPDFAVNMRNEAGLWIETADSKYRGYVYINKTDNAKKEMTISIKRLKMN